MASGRKSFFKLMYGDTIWEKMVIPPKFARLFTKDIDSATTASLVGPSGRAWTVRIYGKLEFYCAVADAPADSLDQQLETGNEKIINLSLKEQKKLKDKADRDMILLPTVADNPYFSVNIKPHNIHSSGYVYVPASFSKNIFTMKTVQCTLMEQNGKQWPVRIYYSLNHWRIGKGWVKFARATKLEMMDTCVFELVEPKKLLMKVTIVRKGQTETIRNAK